MFWLRLLIAIALFLPLSIVAQQDPFTAKENRLRHDGYLKDSLIATAVQQGFDTSRLSEWKRALWAAQLTLYRSEALANEIRTALSASGNLPEAFQKSLLEAAYTLYRDRFGKEIESLLQQTSSLAIFSRAAIHLSSSATSTRKRELLQLGAKKFDTTDHLFQALQQYLLPQASAMPSLQLLLDPHFLPGQTIVFSVQRKNRNYPGLVLIRMSNGELLTNANGTPFHTSQLARSISGYPYFLTNGNTPSGLYRWTGFDTSSNAYIGKTTNLQMVMPYEADAAVFFNTENSAKEWSTQAYKDMFPESWRSYPPVMEAFVAGGLGRSEIIMHGTTINPAYYKGQSYFPNTPSLGCLCSYEEWDEAGKRIKSNQQAIVDALANNGASSGYVMVIDIDDRQAAISLQEVMQLLKKEK